MEVQHFSHEKHRLIFVEELENVGENEVVCSLCAKSVSCGPAYMCSQYCAFFLHKSCAELRREIQHPVHPNHTLLLQAPKSPHTYCDACRRHCKRCFVYTCHICNFDLHIECASIWRTYDPTLTQISISPQPLRNFDRDMDQVIQVQHFSHMHGASLDVCRRLRK
jgi:hypothetical protein